MKEFSKLERALLCMQIALLGAVKPALRAVIADVDVDTKTLYYFFFYDGEISDELMDLASVAGCEASANLSEYFTYNTIERVDYPQKIPFTRGKYAYLRKEPLNP